MDVRVGEKKGKEQCQAVAKEQAATMPRLQQRTQGHLRAYVHRTNTHACRGAHHALNLKCLFLFVFYLSVIFSQSLCFYLDICSSCCCANTGDTLCVFCGYYTKLVELKKSYIPL